MPPSSSLHSSIIDTTSTDVNCVNPAVSGEQLIWPHRLWEKEVLLILQRLIICSDTVINILTKTTKAHQTKSTKKALIKCSNVGHNYNRLSVRQETFLSDSSYWSTSSVCHKLGGKKSALWDGTARL
uniref:Uncharacterized protein n=1 Tax=Arion vulgaris TaxID=1028688 RepID=A0A0B7B747_9EUPU